MFSLAWCTFEAPGMATHSVAAEMNQPVKSEMNEPLCNGLANGSQFFAAVFSSCPILSMVQIWPIVEKALDQPFDP